MTVKNNSSNTLWYFALIFILAAGILVWALISLKVDRFTELVKSHKDITVLITIDDGKYPLISEILFYNPVSRNSALINIPKETGTLIDSIDKVDRLESVYSPSAMDSYIKSLENLLGTDINFVLRISTDSFEKLVDLFGGIDIFISNPVDTTINGRIFLFPPGSVSLDGAKSESYAEYQPPEETIQDRTAREHRIVKSVLKQMGGNSSFLLNSGVSDIYYSLFTTDMDAQSLGSFTVNLLNIDFDRIVYQGIIGSVRYLDGKKILFPYYDGKLIRETVSRVKETLARSDNFSGNIMNVSVEILNGTNINGLASRTAQIFRSYGFQIASVSNADRDDYERTVVLDRRGNVEAVRRVAELIRCSRIHSKIDRNRDETIDVTVILGKDFDGRYVKE